MINKMQGWPSGWTEKFVYSFRNNRRNNFLITSALQIDIAFYHLCIFACPLWCPQYWSALIIRVILFDRKMLNIEKNNSDYFSFIIFANKALNKFQLRKSEIILLFVLHIVEVPSSAEVFLNHRWFHSLICWLTVLCVSSAYRSVVVTEACPRKFLIAIIGTPASSICIAQLCLIVCGVYRFSINIDGFCVLAIHKYFL